MSALLVEKSGPVVTFTLNRPESRNPLGEEGDGDLFAAAWSGGIALSCACAQGHPSNRETAKTRLPSNRKIIACSVGAAHSPSKTGVYALVVSARSEGQP